MKIAIVSDWLVTFAGAEKVLAEIIQCFPKADLFSLIDFLSDEDRSFLQHKKATTTFMQKLPFAKKRYRSYLPLMPLAIEQLDLSGYDLVISSSHAIAKGVITSPHQTHICYIHSPMRYAWDMQHQYLKEARLERGLKGYMAKWMLHKMRIWDYRTANGVDHFVANSSYIAERVLKTYRREASVIYPPIDLSIFKPDHHKENFYLTASRMVPYKKIPLIVESFLQMPDKKLIVIGDGPDFKKIKKLAGPNIQILGFQSTAVLIEYLQKAKAFVFAAEEDFGLLPLEAQATGTPVIAYQRGGATETVRGIDDAKPTGVFFKEQTVAAICQAVQKFEKNSEKITLENCVENASRFSSQNFQEKFTKFVYDKVGNY
jgi:glycosyltransferase involved in cell wall biosynthesis